MLSDEVCVAGSVSQAEAGLGDHELTGAIGPVSFLHTWLSVLGYANTLVTFCYVEHTFSYSVQAQIKWPSAQGY